MSAPRFKPYPRYKDSHAEWLGAIPSHWDARRLKFLLSAPLKYGANEAAELDEPNLPRYVRITDIDEHDRLRDNTFKSLPTEVAIEYLLREGDLLLARSGATAGKTFLYRQSWGSCAYAGYLIRARLSPANSCSEFVKYFTTSQNYWQWLSATFIQATIQNVSADRYASLVLPIPSIPEQRAIVGFLDRETARIDALIAKQERLIELLEEKRTERIEGAVTGNAAKTRTAAGGSRAFSVRAAWQMRKLRRLLLRVKRPVVVEPDGEYREIGIRSWGKGIFHKDVVKGAQLEDKSVFRVEPGDFVLNIVFAWEGAVAVVSNSEVGMVASHRFPTFRPSDEVDLDYLLMVLQSEPGRALMSINSPGAAGRNRTIRLDQFLEEEVPLPPVDEQREIVREFRDDERLFGALLTKAHEAIAYLTELRIALISAAVTGEIDVRNWAAEQPAAVRGLK